MDKRWNRWNDWAAVVLGIVAGLSVLWVETSATAMWTLIVFGVLLLVSGVWSLASPSSVASEYTHVALGVLVFISPWVLTFSALSGAAWTAWIIGVLTVAVGVAAIPVATTSHRSVVGQH